MFQEYYGLRAQPFGVTPDPSYLYFSATHREALASLFYGIESGCGFLTLIAPPGMGKTTLLFHLLEKLRGCAQTVFLFQTQCGSREFFRYLLTDLGVEAGEQNLARMHESLNAVLLRNTRMGRRMVLVIDEAQNLEDSVLETVRLLSDFETPQAKLLQIVLSGQPQLATKLSHPSLTQLRQRISIVSRLHPFTRIETMIYIEYRLCKADYSGPPLFAYDAIDMIATHSGGIPRNINNICFNALTLGFAKRQKQIDASIIFEVLADLDIEGLGSQPQAPGQVHRDSLSSFDELLPTDESTYQEFHLAVRAAWGRGSEAKVEEVVKSNPAPVAPSNGHASLDALFQTSVGPQEASESPIDPNRLSDKETAAHFSSLQTLPVGPSGFPRLESLEAPPQPARRGSEESLPPVTKSVATVSPLDFSPPDLTTASSENKAVPPASTPQSRAHAAAPATAHARERYISAVLHLWTDVWPSPTSIRKWLLGTPAWLRRMRNKAGAYRTSVKSLVAGLRSPWRSR
jgi:general secretion pathway protein A